MILADFLTEAGEAPVYYFAYGMLTDPEIMDGIELVGVAKLPNFRYEMLEYADVVPTPGSVVYGCLWKVDRRIIANLDRVEGYPTLYDRKTVPAYVNGEKYAAELYTMTPATREQLEGTMPRQSYVNKIVRGYNHAGVPLEQVKTALKVAYHQRKETVDEVAMNPKAFAGSLEQAQTKGVLVGFEFEVCVPAASLGKEEKAAVTHKDIKDIFTRSDYWVEQDVDEGISIQEFNTLFKLKPGVKSAYPTLEEAYNAYASTKVETAKELFHQIPENIRKIYIAKVKRRSPELVQPNVAPGVQLKFAYMFGREIYYSSNNYLRAHGLSSAGVDKVKKIANDLTYKVRSISWERLISQFLSIPYGTVDREFNNYFDYDPAQVYSELELKDYEDNDEYDDLNYHDYDYDGAAKLLEPALKRAFGREVHVFSDYHEEDKNLKDWYIEPDGSLGPDGENDGAAEIVSPPLPASEAMMALKNFYGVAQQLNLYTNSTTGLHINVSIPGDLDVLKLAVFLGDQYVLKQWGREKNSYAASAEKSITKKAPGKLTRSGKIDYNKLQKIAADATGFHTASISNNGKYISFRHAGGDYLADYAKVANTVGRFIRAMVIAADPNAYAQEYQTKLAKLTQSPSGADADIVSYLRTKGTPAFTVSFWNPPPLAPKVMTPTAVKQIFKELSDMPANTWQILSITPNSEPAKQLIVDAMRDPERKEEAIRRPLSTFSTAVIVPTDAETALKFLNFRQRGVQLSNRRAYGLIRNSTIPPTDPITQNLLKSALKTKYTK